MRLRALGERESGGCAARGGGRGVSRGARGTDTRAGSARVGDDAEPCWVLRFQALGVRESGTARLEEAVHGLSCGTRGADARAGSDRLGGDAEQSWLLRFKRSVVGRAGRRGSRRRWRPGRALEVLSGERYRSIWAVTQNNLGDALRTLGERESGTARLEEAVRAYSLALEEWTRERVPLQWARIQVNLALRYRRWGSCRNDRRLLTEAVTALCSALKERTRQRVPSNGRRPSRRQCALRGSASGRAGRRGSRRRPRSCRARAGGAVPRERVPLDWASHDSNNLGGALATLGEAAERDAAARGNSRGSSSMRWRRRRLSAGRGRLLAAGSPSAASRRWEAELAGMKG